MAHHKHGSVQSKSDKSKKHHAKQSKKKTSDSMMGTWFVDRAKQMLSVANEKFRTVVENMKTRLSEQNAEGKQEAMPSGGRVRPAVSTSSMKTTSSRH